MIQTRTFKFVIVLVLIQQMITQNCYGNYLKKTFFSSSNMTPNRLGKISNKLYLLYLTSDHHDEPGGLLYNEPIDFNGNFHLLFAVKIHKGNQATFDGMSVVFGNHKDLLFAHYGEHIGYGGIQPKAYAIEMDYYCNSNQNDPQVDHMSIHRCFESACEVNEINTIKKEFPSDYQWSYLHYEHSATTEDKIWYFHFLYNASNKKLQIYLGSIGTVFIEDFVDLGTELSKGYLAFTGFMRHTKHLSIDSSFLCTSLKNYQISFNPSTEIKVGENLKIQLDYTNSSAKNNANAKITSDNNLIKQSTSWEPFDYWYWYWFKRYLYSYQYKYATFTGFTITGKCLIIYEDIYQKNTYEINVISTVPNTLAFWGYDNIQDSSKIQQRTNKDYYFNWGTIIGSNNEKNFEYDTNNNFFITPIFLATDRYNNRLTQASSTHTELQKLFSISVTGPSGNVNFSIINYGNSLFQIKIKPTRPGVYSVKSPLFTNSYAFKVENILPSQSSFCKIDTNLSDLSKLPQNVSLQYKCFLYNSLGAELNPKDLTQRYKIQFIVEKEVNGVIITKEDGISESQYFSKTIVTSESGKYILRGFWIKDEVKYSIASSRNSFTVIPKGSAISGSRFYFYYPYQSWFEIDSYNEFYFDYKTENIFAIDFKHTDGKYFSEIENGYDNFDLNELSGYVSCDHSSISYKQPVKIRFGKGIVGTKKAILGIADLSTFYRKSSFSYTIAVFYKSSFDSKETVIKKSLAPNDYNIGKLTSCPHDIGPEKSTFTKINNLGKLALNTQYNIGLLTLKTEDSYFYNYNDYADKLSFTSTPTGLTGFFEPVKPDGTYNFYIKTVKLNTYKINILVDNKPIQSTIDNIEFIGIQICHKMSGDTLNDYSSTDPSKNEYILKKVYNTDENPNIQFNGYDKYDNKLFYSPSSTNAQLGISIEVSVDGKGIRNSYIQFKYNADSKQTYSIIDSEKYYIGTYKIVLKAKEEGKTITFSYKKIPGKINYSTSGVKVNNPLRIYKNQYIKVTVEMKDTYGHIIGIDQNAYNEEIKQVIVKLIQKNTSDQSQLKLSSEKDGYHPIYQLQATNEGIFDISGYAYGSKIPKCLGCTFEIVFDEYSIEKSIMKVILDKSFIIQENIPLIVQNSLLIPMFNFFFKKENGEDVEELKKVIDIEGYFKCPNMDEIKLTKTWSSSNSLLWVFPDNGKDVNTYVGLCELNIKLLGTNTKFYKVNMLGSNYDFDTTGTIDYSNTLISLGVIQTQAGKQESFIVKFMTTNNLYYQNVIDINKLSITSSKGNTNQVQITKTAGSDLGQILVTVITTIVSTTSDPIILNFMMDGTQLSSKIELVVSHSNLDSFEIESNCFEDSTTKTLKKGTIELIPIITLKAYDKYRNTYTALFDSNQYTQEHIARLFTITHNEKGNIATKIQLVSADYIIQLQLSTEKTGLINIQSLFLNKNVDTYKLTVSSGKISPELSYSNITSKTTIKAGESVTFVIQAVDTKGNKITDMSESDAKKFIIKLNQLDKLTDLNIQPTTDLANGKLTYTIPLTKTEKSEIKGYYLDTEIYSNNKYVTVINSDLDLTKTTIKYDEGLYTSQTPINIPIITFPHLNVILFDKHGNIYQDSPVKLIISFNNINDILCQDKIKNSFDVYICQIKHDDYKKLTPKEYPLIITQGSDKIDFKIILTGNRDSEELETSDKPLDISNASIDTVSLSTTVGVYGRIGIEIKTIDGKRPKTFFPKPNESIKLVFSKSEYQYDTMVTIGEKTGQYNIYVTSKKAYTDNDNIIAILIRGTEVIKKVKLIISPGEATTGYFIDSNDKKMENGSFPNANVDHDSYYLKLKLFDKYDNPTTSVSQATFNIVSPNPNEIKTLIEARVTEDQLFGMTIQPKSVGKYQIYSNLWKNDHYFNCFVGKPTDSNSIISIPKTATAGDSVKITITPNDQYNNNIDSSTLPETSYIVNYRYKNPDGSFGDYQTLTSPKIETIDNKKVFVYTTTLTNKGNLLFQAITSDTKNEITCANCALTIIPAQFDITKSLLKKLDVTSGTFIDFIDETLEENKTKSPLFRLYPRDKFENDLDKFPITTGFTSTLYLGSTLCHTFKMNPVPSDASYIEFIKTNESYNDLLGGTYTYKITYQNNLLSKQIVLCGDKNNPNDSVAQNQILALSKTIISDSKLSFKAGDSGFIVILLRTEMNTKYIMSEAESKNILITVNSCDSTDTSFKVTKNSIASKSTFFISFTTTKSNTFPFVTACPLKIGVSGAEISSLKPEILVYHSVFTKAVVSDSDLVSVGSTQLKPGFADLLYLFRIIAKDKYNNIAKTSEEELKIVIKDNSSKVFDYQSSTDVSTGYQNYVVSLKTVMTYTITAGVNEEDVNLFAKPYTISILAGSFSSSNARVRLENPVIIAGSSSSLYLLTLDMHQNNVDPSTVINEVVVTVKSSKGIVRVIPGVVKNNEIMYADTLTEKGANEWSMNYKQNKLASEKTIINSNECDPSKTLIYGKNAQGIDALISKDDPLYSSDLSPLTFTLLLRDVYENIVNPDSQKHSVINAVMSKHNMLPITFTFKISSDTTRLEVHLPNNSNSIYAFNHLVQRMGYEINFTIKNNNTSKTQAYTKSVNHFTQREDSKYGNGYYDINASKFTKEITVRVDTDGVFEFTLKTKENLIYNDDIKLENGQDIKYQLSKSNSAFKCVFTKASDNYGEYRGTLSTTLLYSYPDQYNVLISVKDLNNPTQMKEIGKIVLFVLIGVPDPTKTDVIEKPESVMSSNKPILLKFKLFDRFSNRYLNKDVINQLDLTHNNIEKTNVVKSFIGDDVIQFSYTPSYPPRDINFNILYKENGLAIDVFKDDIKTEIVSNYDPSKTSIFGKNLLVMKAGELLDLNAVVYDDGGICINTDTSVGDIIATVVGPLKGFPSQTYLYEVLKNPEDPSSMCKLSYTAKVTEKSMYNKAGTYMITVSIGGVTIQTLMQTVTNNVLNSEKFTAVFNDTERFNPDNVQPDEKVLVNIQAFDIYGNKVTNTQISKFLNIKVFDSINKEIDASVISNEELMGTVIFSFSSTKTGTFFIKYYYSVTEDDQKTELTMSNSNKPTQFKVIPGSCTTKYKKIDDADFKKSIVGTETYIRVICKDDFDNQIISGGMNFTSSIVFTQGEKKTSVKSSVKDNNDGTYDMEFVPLFVGTYYIRISLNGEKYEDYTKTISATRCQDTDKPYECADGKCVANRIECIEQTDCPPTAPFKCKVNDQDACVPSRTACDNYNPGLFKCDYMNVLVPDKNLCSFNFKINCKNVINLDHTKEYVMNEDGICRRSLKDRPNQRGCPIDSVLCPDFSCAQSYDKCELYPQCNDYQVRCPGQSCTSDQKYCPSTITCPTYTDIVCPEGSCVKTELDCSPLPNCPAPNTYRCPNNSCSPNKESCPLAMACGHGLMLCHDSVCRDIC